MDNLTESTDLTPSQTTRDLSTRPSSITTSYIDSRNKSKLTFRSSETILINGRVINTTIVNSGLTPAKDVVVAIEASPATFEFNADHVHAFPPFPFETVNKKGKLEVKLTSPLGKNQTVSITVDELRVKYQYDPMFLIWTTSESGSANRQGHEVIRRPALTLEQYF